MAVVLDLFVSGPTNRERVHIAITPVVRRQEFALDDLDDCELQTLQFEQHYSPSRDVTLVKTVPCVYKYPNIEASGIEIIGSVEPGCIYSGPLSEHVDTSIAGAFPSAPKIDRYLGNEAVIAWRRLHDADAWNAIVAESKAKYFAHEEKRLRDAREKARMRRQQRKRTRVNT
ncbi:MAG: hypothetical protein IPP88_23200 [Betaproteobacteria bacterium]|nr:hypothetical protein [Betaproteobacteria bacterium]